MRIVHYLNHTRRANGHVAVAVDLACEQARHHDVFMISADGDFDDQLRARGVKIVKVALRNGSLRPLHMALDLWAPLYRIRPNIVNAHMISAGLAAWLLKPLLQFKLVTTVHNSFDRRARLMRFADRVIAVSEAVRDQMEAAGIPRAKLRVVTNGTIGGGRRPLLPRTSAVLQHPAVVTICGMHSRKGVAYLLEAFATVLRARPDAHLYLVGDGPEREKYEHMVRTADISSQVHFLGYMDDPREVLASADVFALASLREPFGLVLGEARQMGVPIVATQVDGIPEVLAHGRRGLLVPPADSPALAKALIDLLGDERLRRRLVSAAQEDLDNLTVARMSARTIEVYADALRRGDLPPQANPIPEPAA